jgi:competence ComEA-like helix-hairpin-helix protein
MVKISRSQHLMSILLAAALFSLWFFFHRDSNVESGSIPAKKIIVAEAVGQVKRPGIYFFEHGINVKELLSYAGGATTEQLIPDSILESPVPTGTRVEVSSSEEEAAVIKKDLMAARKRIVLGIALDANLASAEELAYIPGISLDEAAEIVRLRERKGRFERLEEISAVRGIDRDELNKLEYYLVVKP